MIPETYFNPRHNVVADISSLGVLGAASMHYLPAIAFAMPILYYGLLSINILLDWRSRWKRRKDG